MADPSIKAEIQTRQNVGQGNEGRHPERVIRHPRADHLVLGHVDVVVARAAEMGVEVSEYQQAAPAVFAFQGGRDIAGAIDIAIEQFGFIEPLKDKLGPVTLVKGHRGNLRGHDQIGQD